MTEPPWPGSFIRLQHDRSTVSRGARTDAFVNLALLPHSATVPTLSHNRLVEPKARRRRDSDVFEQSSDPALGLLQVSRRTPDKVKRHKESWPVVCFLLNGKQTNPEEWIGVRELLRLPAS